MGYSMAFLVKNKNKTVMVLFNLYLGDDKRVQTFPKGISPKVKVIVWLEGVLTYYNVSVQYIIHKTQTLPQVEEVLFLVVGIGIWI